MRTSIIVILGSLVATAALPQEQTPDKRLLHAASAIAAIQTSEKPIPPALFTKAQCVIIIPGLIRGAFLFGGKYGKGFVSCRRPGTWSAPAAMTIEGGSFGSQLGGTAVDLVVLVMNRSGMDHLLRDKVTFGADIAVVEGKGFDATANSDAFMRAPMISWSRAKGLFVGMSLEGASLRPDKGENRKLYGKDIDHQEILVRKTAPPKGARPFVAALNKAAPNKPVAKAKLVVTEAK
jgi:lipid-binding SYLF domain-containing protein